MEAKEPIIVNHGNVFGTGNWYVFYCGTCQTQVERSDEICKGSSFIKGCGTPIKWNKQK